MKPRLPTIVLFLLFGGLVNVAVAWACAYLVSFGPFTGQQGGAQGAYDWTMLSWKAFGSQRIVFVRVASGADDPERDLGRPPPLPAWCRMGPGDPSPASPTLIMQAAEARGWPLPALSTVFVPGSDPGSFLPRGRFEGVEIEPSRDPTNVYNPSARTLPLRPVWWGFLANTLLYGGAAWVLVHLPFAARRFGRARRGLCPACGYAVGESAVCPECGAPRKKTPETRPQEAE